MFYKIVRFFNRLPYNIYYGITNLVIWFPAIWQDRDWDYYFFYKILRLKLKNMEDLHRNYAHYVGSEKEADRLKLCVLLLDRLIDDNYYDIVFKNHEKKWGSLTLGTSDGKCNISREKVYTEEDSYQEMKESKKLYQKENDLRKQDVDMLFDTIKKYVEGWWD